MNVLTLFGLFVVTAVLVFYVLEERQPLVRSRIRCGVRAGVYWVIGPRWRFITR